MRIIYPNETGGISVLFSAIECGLKIDEIARKDVPAGIPYKIISTVDVPSDRMFRAAWESDFSKPDGYGIGHDAWFAEQDAKRKAEEAAKTGEGVE